jgi:alpha-1,2-mannosyltransferase
VLAAAVVWHLVMILAPPRVPPPANTEGRDFASYYYAAKVAVEGGDPYDKAALEQAALDEGTRPEVHPFFYPPPFLLAVAWAPLAGLKGGFGVWFLLNEVCLLAACLALIRWWRVFGEVVTPLLAVVVALMVGVAYSFELGQANFPVLALVLAGLGLEQRRPAAAGFLVGLACMMKMSPALLVVWWLYRKRYVAVAGAVAAGIVSSIAVLPLVGFAHQWEFYTKVLPQFASGDYNGLSIKIEMFGNHSVPNLLHQAFHSGENRLSAVARMLSMAFNVTVLAALAWFFHRPTEDPVRLAGQACAVLGAMLLIPVYTYEHHLVMVIPAMVFVLLAVLRGWLPRAWAAPIGIAVAVLMFDLPALRQLAMRVVTQDAAVAFFAVQELKFAALCVVFAACVAVGATALRDPSKLPPPRV